MLGQTAQLFASAGLQLTEEERKFIDAAAKSTITAVEAAYTLYAAKVAERALERHAAALEKASEAATKQTRGLKWATWCLVAATVVLAAATAALLLKG